MAAGQAYRTPVVEQALDERPAAADEARQEAQPLAADGALRPTPAQGHELPAAPGVARRAQPLPARGRV
jgi:hypothetical protein